MGETGFLGSRACFQRQSTPDVLTPTCDVHDTTPMAEIDVQLRCSAVPAPRTEVPNAASRPGRAAPSAGSHLRPALPPSLTLLAAQGSSGAAESRLLAKLVYSTLRPTAPESQGADGAGGSAAAAVATICTTAAATAADTGGYKLPAADSASMNGECPQLDSSLSVGGARVNGGDTGGNGAGLYMGGDNDTEELAMAAATPAAAPAAAAVPATAAATPVLHLQIPRSLSEPTPTGRCLHRCGTLPTVMPVAAEVAAAELAPAVAAAVAATEPLPRSVQHVTTVAPRLQLPRDGVAAASAAAAASSACNGHAAASAEQQQVLPPALLSRRRHPRVASRVQGPVLAATCDRIAAVDDVGVAPTDTAAAAAGAAGGYGSHVYTDAAGLDGDDEEDDEDADEDAADEDADENEMSHVIRHVMRMARRHHVQESRAACSRLLQVLEPAGRGNAAGASASGSAATGAAAGSKLAGTAPTMPVAEPVAATVVEAAAAHASHLKCSSSSAGGGGDSDEAQRASYSLSALHYGNSIAAMAVGNGASFCAISSCEVASEDVSAEMAALAAAMAQQQQQQQQPGQAVAAAAAAGGLALVGGGSVAGAEVGGWVERVSRTSLNEALHDRQREVAAGLAAAAAAARGPSGGAAAAVPEHLLCRPLQLAVLATV
ncbi:hypothetical protein CHLRE_10g423150v5 [Chlamydomonas reinhardtii]|uniref:Uncharacterized protein n=1 Tax=Chlamydomonas reinhardtii TaxID=3055 RepID=A0A2K3D9C4_CHLRE|nr:uncharacterized protein CHLRE_10g423150v5 [Chlamydomonas reinhardtii]PNW77125.1 hypothetical protein CHLRE_10g423150v5 [Chlamydomonas reinhardtii]